LHFLHSFFPFFQQKLHGISLFLPVFFVGIGRDLSFFENGQVANCP
jgi:hypothetical protein